MGTSEHSRELELHTDGTPEKQAPEGEKPQTAENADEQKDEPVAGVSAAVRAAATKTGATVFKDGLYNCEGSRRNAFGAGRETVPPPSLES